MNRKFDLAVISNVRYNQLCKELGVEYTVEAKPGQGHYQIISPTDSYDDVHELRKDMNDNQQRIELIWFPQECTLDVAREKSKDSSYESSIYDKAKKYDKLSVHLRRYLPGVSEDLIRLYKERGVWVIRHLNIRKSNFDIYTLSGLDVNPDSLRQFVAVKPRQSHL